MQNLQDYPDLAKEAADAAARMVFQERRANVPGMGGGPAQPEATRFALAQPMPFYKTPVNITAQGGALSPFGFIGAAQSAVKSSRMPRGTLAERNAQGRETLLAEERVARGMIGSAILGMGIFLGKIGHADRRVPDDPKEASTLPQGWRPWSLRLPEPIGGNTIYLPLQNFAMAGFPMAIAAILTDPIHRGRSILDPEEQLRPSPRSGATRWTRRSCRVCRTPSRRSTTPRKRRRSSRRGWCPATRRTAARHARFSASAARHRATRMRA